MFVSINSTDKKVLDVMKRIEKTFHLEMWVNKSQALLEAYLNALDENDNLTDKVLIGKKIQECESYIISCVTYYMRCFMDQPTFHLNANEFIKNPELRKCFIELRKLRDDDFVHWKGLNSSLSINYSFDAITEKEVEFAKQYDVHYKEKIGPWDEKDVILELIQVTRSYIQQRREDFSKQLRKLLSLEETYLKTEILDSDGKSVIKNHS